MAADILRTGGVVIEGLEYPRAVVNYGRKASLTKTLLGAARWTQTGGRPGFTWLVRGKRCYQARKDSSIGGSGAHRWNDPSTWEWTDNLIDCRYNWVRGIYAGDRVDNPDMLLVGRGLTAIEAPPVNVFAPANLCDEIVPIDADRRQRHRWWPQHQVRSVRRQRHRRSAGVVGGGRRQRRRAGRRV